MPTDRERANARAYLAKVAELRRAVNRDDWTTVALLATELESWDFEA